MAEWYLATYQNSVFSSDLGIIQPSGDYVYKLKNGIQSGESPVKSDWLRIGITDNKVEEWDNSSGTPAGEGVTGLVYGSIYWVYGKPYSYKIVTDDQTYYLKSFNNNQNGFFTGKYINNLEFTIPREVIRSITIGNSVTTIGSRAFKGCYDLVSVIIDDSVTTIGERAFDECPRLASLTIGNSVTSIGDNAFRDCESLASLIIPDSVTSIGNSAFKRIGENITNDGITIITISQSTVRRLMESDNYYSGNRYKQAFFSNSNVILNVI